MVRERSSQNSSTHRRSLIPGVYFQTCLMKDTSTTLNSSRIGNPHDVPVLPPSTHSQYHRLLSQIDVSFGKHNGSFCCLSSLVFIDTNIYPVNDSSRFVNNTLVSSDTLYKFKYLVQYVSISAHVF